MSETRTARIVRWLMIDVTALIVIAAGIWIMTGGVV